VFFSDCKFALNNMGKLELSFNQTQRDMTRNRRGASQKEKGSEEYQAIQFDLANDLREVKYYIAGDTSDNEEASVRSSDDSTESMSFLAMKVDISKSINFRYPNHYKPNGRDLSKGFILVEFRSDTEFTNLLQIVEGITSLRPYFDKQAQLTTKTAESYCKPFIKDSNNERIMSRNSIESPSSRNKQGFLAGKKEEDILLVFPFDGDEELIEKAAKGLNEASRGGRYNADSSSEKVVVEAMETDTTDLEVSDKGKASSGGSDEDEAEPETKTRGRAHFLTVRVEDYERLEPGEFLNDTLIDFWMQWYVSIECAPAKVRNVKLTLALSFYQDISP
jgi:Ulp1 family protease